MASATEPNDRRWVAASVLPPGAEELLPAITDTARRFEIPHDYLLGVIDGVLADQSQRRFETFAALDEYCYLVASTVGLACIHVWGYRTPLPRQAAIDCGLAFQLTNILRDLREDAARDRIYLPKELWGPLGLEDRDMLGAQPSPAMAAVVSRTAERASDLYRRGWDVFPMLHADGQRMFSMIWRTYRSLLARIERDPFQVLNRRVRVGLGSKLWIAGTHFFGPAFDRLSDPRADARFASGSPGGTDGDCRAE